MYTSEWCVSGTGTLTVDDMNPREVVLLYIYIGFLRDIDECTWCPLSEIIDHKLTS